MTYTSEDINYSDSFSRATREQQDSSVRPAIDGSIADKASFHVIYLGFPIWWGEEPRIIDTFIESYDLSGNVLDGRRFEGNVSKEVIEEWMKSIG